MKKIIIALLVLAACGTAVFAGEMKKEGSAGLGYAMPMGDWGDSVGGGIGFEFGYEGYKINDMLTVGANLFYTKGTAKDVLGFDYSDISYSTLGITPYVKAEKELDLGGKKTNLYGIFGLGIYNTSNTSGNVKYGNTVVATATSGSSSNIGINFGGGLMYPLNDKMKVGGEIKYHAIFASDTTVSYLVPAAKFTYSF